MIGMTRRECRSPLLRYAPRIVISSAADKSSLHAGFLAGWLYCLT